MDVDSSALTNWSPDRLHHLLTTMTADEAPGDVNWWEAVRTIAQNRAYSSASAQQDRLAWAELALLASQGMERHAGVQHIDAVLDRFSLRTYLIMQMGVLPDDPVRDPDLLAGEVLAEMSMTSEDAVRMSATWRSRSITEVRLLRQHKALVGRVAPIRTMIRDPGLRSQIDGWLEIRPVLP